MILEFKLQGDAEEEEEEESAEQKQDEGLEE